MAIHYPSHLLRVIVPILATFMVMLTAFTSEFKLSPQNIAIYAGAALAAWIVEGWASKLAPTYLALYGNHWASLEDIRPQFLTKRQTERGVLLGYAYGRRFGILPGAAGRKELGNVLVVAPSRRGKGLQLVSNLLTWKGSAVVVDIKGENFERTAGHRAKMGQRILVLDPAGYGNRYDPFAELSTDEGLNAIATMILEPDKDGSNRAFALRAGSVLFAMMKAATLEKKAVLRAVREYTAMGMIGCVQALGTVQDEEVRRRLVDFLGNRPEDIDWGEIGGDKFLNNSWQGMIAKLNPFFSKGILAMTAGSDFTALDLVRQPTTLYLVFRESDLRFTGAALRMVLLGMVNALMRSFDAGERSAVETLFAFDEAGTVVVPDLDRFVATAAGRGIVSMIYLQDLPQLETIYGRAAAATIRANCHTQVYYKPLEFVTASYISDMLGKRAVVDTRYAQHSNQPGVGEGFGLRARELMSASEVTQLPLDRCIAFVDVVSGSYPVMLHRMEPWFVPGYARATALPPPALALLPGLTFSDVPARSPAKRPKARKGKPRFEDLEDEDSFNDPFED